MKRNKFNKILFCRILLLVTQFIAPPVAVTQPHVVCPPTAQWLPVTARWLPCTCQMTALSLFDNCLATRQQLYGNWTVTARWLPCVWVTINLVELSYNKQISWVWIPMAWVPMAWVLGLMGTGTARWLHGGVACATVWRLHRRLKYHKMFLMPFYTLWFIDQTFFALI